MPTGPPEASRFTRRTYDRTPRFDIRSARVGECCRARAGARQAGQERRAVHAPAGVGRSRWRSEEHTSELQSLMRISYAVFCLKKKKKQQIHRTPKRHTDRHI